MDEGSLVITNKARFKRKYYEILDRFLAEFDMRFTANDLKLNSLETFDIASEKFMNITNFENVANFCSNHIDDVVLSSPVMQQKHMWHLLLKVQSIQILKR